ncbi:hypothetical protein NF672_10710 [Pseudomonas moraviensis]|uniref:hypothetical protein n=1 Tax=Pseudomonas moraviensis TaxID=321662 RepID=UPI002093F733|nr:hypothetical protein [Pseudomonas moraviensis]UST60984.1 hypothetical protein NF672_10710 [Pseudomonas moraviensis]
MIKERKAIVYPPDKLLLTCSSETPYNVDSARLTNRISDSFTQAKKRPESIKTETGLSPLRRPLFQVVKVVSQELVKAQGFQQSPYKAQRTQQKLHTFWPPGWRPNLQQTYRTMRAFSRLVRVADEAAG